MPRPFSVHTPMALPASLLQGRQLIAFFAVVTFYAREAVFIRRLNEQLSVLISQWLLCCYRPLSGPQFWS